MSGYIIWVILLAIWNTVLFFSREYGINVILFNIPLMYYMYYILKSNNLIKNKKGLYLVIPIVLLSLSYAIFNNELFAILDFLLIPILIAVCIIYTTNETYKINNIFEDVIEYLFLPYRYVGRLFRITKNKIIKNDSQDNKIAKIFKVLIVVVPITLIVLGLLSSADLVFDEIFGEIFDFLEFEFLDNLLGRITFFIIMFFVIGCTTMYILFENKKHIEIKKKEKNVDLLTSKTLLCVLNAIYLVFDFIQIKSFIFHDFSNNIDYASYAREGFFELLVVSVINLAIILITRRFENNTNKKEFNFIKTMEVIMIFLTIIIIIFSFLRMHMYELEYGYTVLRLLVFAALITESIMMIPTVMYIFNKDFDIIKSYLIISLVSFICLNYMNMDYVIARKNVNRYYYTENLDIDYLNGFGYDNVPVLVELYNKIEDPEIKNSLETHLYYLKEDVNNYDSIFEFSLSKYKAKKILNKIDLKEKTYEDYLDY